MGFEWDAAKSDENLRRRGFDFAFAARIFEGPTREWPDRRRDYGEARSVALGAVGDDVLVVVYTWRGAVRRIISARAAKRKERHVYRSLFER